MEGGCRRAGKIYKSVLFAGKDPADADSSRLATRIIDGGGRRPQLQHADGSGPAHNIDQFPQNSANFF